MTSPSGNPVPLKMIAMPNTAENIVHQNLEATFKRGYVPFREAKDKRQGPVSIVGAGYYLQRHRGRCDCVQLSP
jgi:hypothetical protein